MQLVADCGFAAAGGAGDIDDGHGFIIVDVSIVIYRPK